MLLEILATYSSKNIISTFSSHVYKNLLTLAKNYKDIDVLSYAVITVMVQIRTQTDLQGMRIMMM